MRSGLTDAIKKRLNDPSNVKPLYQALNTVSYLSIGLSSLCTYTLPPILISITGEVQLYGSNHFMRDACVITLLIFSNPGITPSHVNSAGRITSSSSHVCRRRMLCGPMLIQLLIVLLYHSRISNTLRDSVGTFIVSLQPIFSSILTPILWMAALDRSLHVWQLPSSNCKSSIVAILLLPVPLSRFHIDVGLTLDHLT